MGRNKNGAKRKFARKQRLFLEQNGRCYWCGKYLMTVRNATEDHLLPKSRGGTDKLQNLVIACQPCNNKRRNRIAPQKRGHYSAHEWHPEFIEVNAMSAILRERFT